MSGAWEAQYRIALAGGRAMPGPKRLAAGDTEADLGDWDLTGEHAVWLPIPSAGRMPARLSAGGAVVAEGLLLATAALREAVPDPFFDASGAILVAEHSHSDLAWDHSIPGEAAVRNRNLEAVFRQMRRDPSFRWTIECVRYYRDWLAAHPETEAELQRFFRDGRLDCGATYTQPLEDCLYGELLARQVYAGKRWFEQWNPGIALLTAVNQDSPMRGHQAQQVYAKAGVRYLKGARMRTPEFFKWFSPDGSHLVAWVQDAYWGRPQIEPGYFHAQMKAATPRRRAAGLPPVLGLTWGHDYNDPVDLRPVFDAWNAAATRDGTAGAAYATFAEVLRAVEQRCAALPEVRGGVPDWWVYELWPSHRVALSTQRQAAKDLVAAETFQTVLALLNGSFARYPQAALDEAWTAASFACHTMVPAPAPPPDAAMLAQYQAAAATGIRERDAALRAIASRVKPTREGTPLVIFNRLSWVRSDPVTAVLPEGAPWPAAVVDDQGRRVPCQSAGERTIVFVASDVPAVGYRTFHAVAESDPPPAAAPAVGSPWTEPFTSRHYVVTPGAGGLAGIRDRELDRDLLDTERWQAGEWVAFATSAMGACEGIDFAPHPERFLARLRDSTPAWTCTESGPVFVRWQTAPTQWAHGEARLSVTVFREYKRIDFAVNLRNAGRQGFEQRLVFPLRTNPADLAYEVPFGVVRPGQSEPFLIVGPSGTAATPESVPHAPREVQDWVYAGGEGVGVTLGTSVGAVAFRDFGPGAGVRPLVAPILLADIGNPQRKAYVQPGTHDCAFSLTSHAPGYQNGFRAGIASQNPLYTVAAAPAAGANLPPVASFFALSGECAVVSTIKKAEDGEAVVVRLFDLAGRGDTVTLHGPRPVAAARQTDLLERGGKDLAVSDRNVRVLLGAHAIETVLLQFVSSPPEVRGR
jgi:alpha-mannosidase